MATTRPVSPNKAETKLTSDTVDSVRNANASTKSAQQPTNSTGAKSVNLDVIRKDIAKVEVVDTDFVLTTKSGRKILIRDGALNAVTDEEFSVVFSDDESVSAKVLFNESQSTAIDTAPLNWSDAATAETAALVIAAPIVSGVSYTTLGGAALLAALAAGGGGGGSTPPNDAAKAKAALDAIGKFANDNADSMPTKSNQYIGTEPTVETYVTAGVIEVNALSAAAINDALATEKVTAESVNTLDKLQALVNAYNLVLALANGEATSAATRPTADQYTLLGVRGLEAVDPGNTSAVALLAAKTKLLSDVIDRKVFGDVNTIKEIQALLNSVTAVIDAIAGGTLTKEQLSGLGITGVTDANIALIINAIDKTKDDGTDVDTFIELQNIVDVINGGADARRALDIIVQYAQTNGGIQPSAETYMLAGVTTSANAKITSIEAAAFNDALLTPDVIGASVDTIIELQALVDAYRKVFVLADGFPNNAEEVKDLSQSEFQRIGVNTNGLNNESSRLRLLNDVIDGKSFDDVNTIAEINDLVRIVNAVQDRVAGNQIAITVDDFKELGIKGITASNLDTLINAIASHSAQDTDTVQELQSLLYSNLTLTFDGVSEDLGYRNDDFITSDNTLIFSGTSNAIDGTKVRLTLMRANQSDITVDGDIIDGQWHINRGTTLDDDEYTVKVQLFDGITPLPKVVTFAQHVTVDTHADRTSDPDLNNQTISITAIIDDTGVSDNDFKTSDTSLTYKGTSTAVDGTHVAVKVDGLLNWTVVQNKQWRLDNTGITLTPGVHTIEAYLTDAAGNQAGTSAVQTVTIETAALKLNFKTEGPIGSSSNLILQFSETVIAGGGKKIVITDLSAPNSTPWTINSTDTTQVTIEGSRVIINPTNDLVPGKQYLATIDAGAFETSAGVQYEGLSVNADWTFNVVDPSMVVSFAGLGIDFTNGINQTELASSALVVSGQISSTNLNVITEPKITKIVFTSSVPANSFELVTDLPAVDSSFNWTLNNAPSWTSQLVSGQTYTVTAHLQANIGDATVTSVFSSAPMLVDTEGPVLTKVECDKSFIKQGDFATYTFTFNEDPLGTFDINDLTVAQVGSLKVGQFLSLTGSGNTRTALFRANDGVTFTPAIDSPTVKINPGSFSDFAGNVGTVGSTVVLPNLKIDTQGSNVTGVVISGVLQSGAEVQEGTLVEGDKVRVTVTMNEITQVIGTPFFNVNVGNAVRRASYVRGSGTNTLVFEYTLAVGDSDRSGGITADAKSLQLGAGRIIDNYDNTSFIDTPAIADGTNRLEVVTSGSSDALTLIQNFAQSNTDPLHLVANVAVPTVQNYSDARILGVTVDNIDAINNSLATAVIDMQRINSREKLQELVSAYLSILGLADGDNNTSNDGNPSFLQYGLIGVQFVDTAYKASLLGDVIDIKQKADVDTVAEIQDLANAVAAVMNQARDIPGLTLEQLTGKLTIKDVTADNFAAVKHAIGKTVDDGFEINTLPKLQEIVTKAASKASAALLALQKFANENTESWPVTSNNNSYKGDVPTWSTYYDTGLDSVPGVTDANMTGLINDALATQAVTGSRITTFAALQSLVSAYAAIVKLADGSGTSSPVDLLGPESYNLVGVTGYESSSDSTSITKAQLLSDIIDRKRFDDINTIKEIQALADAVSAVIANAAGLGSVTIAQLKLLGFDVPANKIADVANAIEVTPDDGKEVDTFIELFNLINSKLGAVDKAISEIALFADQNSISQPTPIGSFTYQGKAPTIATYTALGLTGEAVTADEVAAFNDALATKNVTYTSVDTKEEIQALVDAYRSVLKAADGTFTPNLEKLTLQQFSLLGVTGLDITQEATTDISNQVIAARVQLLSDVIDRKSQQDVNTVLELQALADIIVRVTNLAKGVDGLTREDLVQLGIQGVTTDNLAAVLQAISGTVNNGTEVDTYVELQNLVVTPAVNRFTSALALIQAYAKAKTNPADLGAAQEQPTAQTYLDLGIANVSSDNVKSMNSALATASVTDQQVLTARDVQNIVNAYIQILAAADGNPNTGIINPNDYTLLGIDGVVGSEVKISLLSDVIDRKVSTAVDTADELQALASMVAAVMKSAARATAGGLSNAQQLTALGVTGVTADNFSAVLTAIQGTTLDGKGVDTVKKLQDLVNGVLGTKAKAMQVIVDFANDNTASQPLTGAGVVYNGVQPLVQTYLDAGITGSVTTADVASFNDALATNYVTGAKVSDIAKLQTLVEAYRKVFALADGPANPTTASALTDAEVAVLGVETPITGTNRLTLLSDIIDRQSRSGVNTIAKINQLAAITNAIQDQAADLVPTRNLSVEDFTLLGIRGVSSANLSDFLSAIQKTDAAGADSVPELQSLLFNSLRVDFTAISDDTGGSNTDFITNDKTLTFSGTSSAADGTKIRLTLKRAGQTDITLDGVVSNGQWSISLGTDLADGSYAVSAHLIDGTTPLPTLYIFSQPVVVDTLKNDPELVGKTISFEGISTDTGVQGDFTTSDTTLIFSGSSTAAVGSYVAVTVDGGPMVYGRVGDGKIWTVNNTTQILSKGTHKVVAFLTDAAGNIIASDVEKTVTIDTAEKLLVSDVTKGPIASNTQLKLFFSAPVVAVDGKFINLVDESDVAGRVIRLSVKDAQVSINGAEVTLKLSTANALGAGKTYHATVDAGAFVSTAGATFDGLLGANDWRFQTVDPSTTITMVGTAVDASNGLNATELGALTISGVASSPSWVSVSNAKVTKLTFTSTDLVSPHTFSVNTNVNINPDRTWSVANGSLATNNFISGKSYTVQATLTSTINGTDLTTVIGNNTPVLLDTVAPGVTITSDVTQLASGQKAVFTFTFSEVPVGFTVEDITVRKSGTTPFGVLSNFKVTSDPKIYTVDFSPTAGLSLGSTPLVVVAKDSYTDAVGNLNSSDVSSPSVQIDTLAPSVSSVIISGVDNLNADKLGKLDVGDRVKITLSMSEVTTVDARSTPVFGFDLGGVNKLANYDRNSSSGTKLVFYYTIVSGDNDTDGSGLTAVANGLSQASLSDAFGNIGSLSTPVAATNNIIVDTTDSALKSLAAAALANNASPTATPLTLYQKSGATNAIGSNLDSYNSALNSSTVIDKSVDTTAEVRDLVNAYNTILKLADGGSTTSTFATDQQYQLIGVTGLDNPTTVLRTEKANLLSDAIDRKSTTDVDTVDEVQALANAVIAVMKTVGGEKVLTKAQLEALGVTGVTDANLPALLDAIDGTAPDGTGANTVAKLQNLLTQGAINSAITLISNFAGDNQESSNTGDGRTFNSYIIRSGGRKPTVNDFATAGVLRVTVENIDAINDALATKDITALLTDTAVEIQSIVDAYNAVFALADVTVVNTTRTNPNTNNPPVTVEQFKGIGAQIGSTPGNSNISLLNSVLDLRTSAEVDTVQEINTIFDVVSAIMDSTGNRSANSAALLTVNNLTNKLGLGSINQTNIAGILNSIAKQANGDKIDTVAELQSLVNFYNAAAPTVVLADDTGVNTADRLTRTANLTFGTPNFGGVKTEFSIDGGANYALTSSYQAPQITGSYTVLVRQVSAEGYLGQSRSLTFNLDLKTPDAIKLTPTSSTNDVYYGPNDFGKSKSIAPTILLANDSDIAVVTLTVNGIDPLSDRFTYLSSGTTQASFALNTNQPLSAVTIGGVSGVNLKYTYTASSNSGSVDFSSDASRSSRMFTNQEVQDIERALGFTTSSTANTTRTFSFSHIDGAGNSNAATGAATVTLKIDNQPPSKVLFAGSDSQAEVGFYNKFANSQSAAVAIAANIKTPTDTDIAKIQLTFGGTGLNFANDRVLFDGPSNSLKFLQLDRNDSDNGWTIGGVSGVDWVYDATSKALTFSLSSKGAFRNIDVAALEASLRFQIQGNLNTTEGVRTFTFDHIDVAGWSTQTTNNGATKTITADFQPPSAIDLDGNSTGVIDATTLQYLNKKVVTDNASTLRIAPQMGASTDGVNIARFSVVIGGGVPNEDQFLMDIDSSRPVIVDLAGILRADDQATVNTILAGVSNVTWEYTASSRTFTFAKSTLNGFAVEEVQAIEKSLAFKTNGTTQGDRTFTFTHFDFAGNESATATATIKVDTLSPGGIDLDSTKAGVDATSLQYFNQTVLASSTKSTLIAGDISRPAENDIATISVTIGGAKFDPANDKFVINGIVLALNVDLSPTTQPIAGVSGVTISYANKTLTFKKSNGDSFVASDVQKIESTLGFQTNGNSQGDRTFTFTRTDQAGNASASAIATIAVDTFVPEAVDLDGTTAGAQNGSVQTMNIASVANGVSVANLINKASTDEGVASIQVSMLNSEMISADDKLGFGLGSVTFGRAVDDSNNGQSMTIGIATGVSWLYTAANKTLTFRKANNTAFSAGEVQSIEKELVFKTTTNATAGDRLFTFTHSDLAGNISPSATVRFATDLKASVINLAGTAANYSITTTAALTSAVKIAAPNASVTEEDRIASFQIKVQGQRTSNSERFVIGGTEIDASGSVSSGSVTLAATGGRANGSTWNWNYNPASGAFVFAATNVVRGVTTEQAAAFLTSLSYKATTANPGDDVRQFYISATDYVGNKSATESVSTVLISNAPPAKHPTISTALLDGNGDRLIGDKFVLTFSEAVKVSSFLPTASNLKWAINSGSLGDGWTARAVDTISVNGADYATNFLVTTGAGANIVAGQAQTLTLTGQQGGTGNYNAQAGVVLPTFTLTSQAVTLEAWVFADYSSWTGETTQKFQRIFDFGTVGNIPQNGSPGTEIWLGFDGASGKLAFEYINSAPGRPRNAIGKVSANDQMPLKSWQHIAVTFGPKSQSPLGTATLYMNGAPVTGVTVTSSNSVDFDSPLLNSVAFSRNLIGKSNWLEDAGFNGRIFDARVYTNARTAVEIFNDYKGAIDYSDPKMILQYDFNGNANNGASGTFGTSSIASNRNGSILNNTTFAGGGGTTITVSSSNVEDTAEVKAAGTQVEFQLYKKSATTVGGLGNDTIGSLSSEDFKGNNFIAGQGGNDTLTGGSGSDTFAWFSGETGSDTVTDFKVPEGDMIDLSGIFANRTMSNLNLFLQLQMLSNNDAVLKIDISGTGNFASPTKTITFTAGALNGLDNTLAKLVENKVINLTNQDQTPLMLDLDGDGVHTSSLADGVKFDIEGAGQKTFTGWSDGKDGFLVLDLNSDGTINNGTELFGNSTKLADGQTKAKDGFEALRQYDLNQDNLIDANDAVLANLKIWVDANKDGVSQSEELHGLQDIGLRALKLNAEAGHTLDNGNVLSLVSTWVDNRGQEHAFVDVTFATSWQSKANHAVM